MERLEYAKYIIRHRHKVIELSKEYGRPFYFHDLHKLINALLFGRNVAHMWHKKYSHHHVRDGTIGRGIGRDVLEAIIDWESARYTKPDKPYSAREWYNLKVKNQVNQKTRLLIENFLNILEQKGLSKSHGKSE